MQQGLCCSLLLMSLLGPLALAAGDQRQADALGTSNLGTPASQR